MKNTKNYSRKYVNQKNKNYFKAASRTFKNYKKVGGAAATMPIQSSIGSTNLESNSINQLEALKMERAEKAKETAAKANEIIGDAVTVAEGIGANAIEGIGNIIGIDVAHPEKTTEKLNEIKQTLTNPENFKKVQEIIGEAAKKGALMFKAASPLIDPLTTKIVEQGSKVAEKVADTGSTIVSNAVKEIPGVGLVYSLVQDASKIGEATSAVIGAASEIATDTADSAVVFNDNLKKVEVEAKAEAASAPVDALSEPSMTSYNKQQALVGGSKRFLKGLKKDKTIISNRITKSILKFENPLHNKRGTKKNRRVRFHL
jgi:hypothetical protein